MLAQGRAAFPIRKHSALGHADTLPALFTQPIYVCRAPASSIPSVRIIRPLMLGTLVNSVVTYAGCRAFALMRFRLPLSRQGLRLAVTQHPLYPASLTAFARRSRAVCGFSIAHVS